jgi:MFS family permease
VLLALAAMTPGLINFTALDLARSTIGESLGVSADEASWATLLGNAALPLGMLVAANLIGYVPLRRLVLTGLGLAAIGALCGAVAANLPMLVLVHAVQGFACGLVGSAVVLSLVMASSSNRLAITVTVLGIGLFGAVTLGPPIGGVVQQTGAWRELLVLEALVALCAVIPARATVPTATLLQNGRVHIATLFLAAAGLAALFIGIAELSWYHWTRSEVQAPIVLGAAALLALMVGEWARGGPLATVRSSGMAVISSGAAFVFGGLVGLLLEFLLQVRGLGAQDAGMLLWPSAVAAFLGMVWVGVLFSRPRWMMLLAGCGVLLLALAAWQLASFTEYTGDSSVMLVAALLGLGASLSVSPPMLVGALSVPKELVGRALALATFMPYVLLAASAPILTYVSSIRQIIHYSNLQWQEGWKFAMSGTDSTSVAAGALATRALALGINDAALVLVLAALLGVAVMAVLLRRSTRGSRRTRRADAHSGRVQA